MARAVIFGCEGLTLGPDERRFFAAAEPWGFILFARNVEGPAQLRRLTAELRDAVGRDAPVLIDQEGGRVARLRGPDWREWAPALEECARLPERAAAGAGDVSALPADRRRAGGGRHRRQLRAGARPGAAGDARGDPQPLLRRAIRPRWRRSGGRWPTGCWPAACCRSIKHMPGQGRAALDSHLALPRVEAAAAELAADFAPFRALADLPMAMTAHVVYAALDPEAPATQSARVVGADPRARSASAGS